MPLSKANRSHTDKSCFRRNLLSLCKDRGIHPHRVHHHFFSSDSVQDHRFLAKAGLNNNQVRSLQFAVHPGKHPPWDRQVVSGTIYIAFALPETKVSARMAVWAVQYL